MELTHLFGFFLDKENREVFPHYQQMDKRELHWHLKLFFKLLVEVVRTDNGHSLINYYKYLAEIRKKLGFPKREVQRAFQLSIKLFIEAGVKNSKTPGVEATLNKTINRNLEQVYQVIDQVYGQIPHI